MDILQQIGKLLWELVVPGLSAALLAVAFQLARQYVARIGDERLRALIEELVRAAEQIYGAGRGGDKKLYVLDELRARGAAVDPAMIEAAVNRNYPKFPDPAPDADGE